MQRVRHVAVALDHQPNHRVTDAGPVTAVHRHTQHDRPPVAPAPVLAPEALPGHVRRGAVLVGHRFQTRHHHHEHPSEVSRTLLSLLHRLHGPPGAHQPYQHPERRHANVVRRHQQVSNTEPTSLNVIRYRRFHCNRLI